MRPMHRLAILFALLLTLGSAHAEEPARLAPDRDRIEIETDTILEAGTHLVTDRDGSGLLVIRTDGVTLDLGGATLRGAPEDASPDGLAGVGILVEDAAGVTIQNGAIAGFKVGVRAVNAKGLVVEDVDASGNFKQRLKSTPEREDASDWLWPHENDGGEWEAKYGAGISLSDCAEAEVRRCRVRHGQNGVLLTRCTKSFVYDNDFSFNSGWGIALYRTTHTEVSHNRCDFCVRGYSHGVYYRGQDSAGILVFEQSSHNVFVGNSATHSGDGFFLYAGHETTQRTGKGGLQLQPRVPATTSGSRSPTASRPPSARGTCSRRTTARAQTTASGAGYSYGTRFSFNRCHDCMTAGVSIEHGHRNEYLGNDDLGEGGTASTSGGTTTSSSSRASTGARGTAPRRTTRSAGTPWPTTAWPSASMATRGARVTFNQLVGGTTGSGSSARPGSRSSRTIGAGGRCSCPTRRVERSRSPTTTAPVRARSPRTAPWNAARVRLRRRRPRRRRPSLRS